MKISVFLLFVAILQLNAHSSYSQETKMNFNASSIRLKQLFNDIEKQSEFLFFYVDADVEGVEVSVNARNATIMTVLNQALSKTPLTYEINDRYITIAPKGIVVKAQGVTVSGTVTDATGAPMPGVNVVLKGTTTGQVTDISGKFTINVPNKESVLVFSFIGYVSQEMAVGDRTRLDIAMAEDTKEIEEVVVVGYGTVKKSDLTGSVTQVSANNFNKGVNSSVDQSIMGKVAGVQVRQTSAEPGGGTSIRIRGATSITGGNDPLYVIDGLPIDNSPTMSAGGGAYLDSNPNMKNPITTLNPNDIESIEILKDASATAIYGSRGANGVIIITTKKGTKGKATVEFNANAGIQKITKRYDILNAQEYMTILNSLSKEKGEPALFSENDFTAVGEGTDWQDEVYRTASIQDYNLSFRGGNEMLNYYVSGNYFNQKGIIKNNGLEKYTLKANLESQVTSRLRLNLNLNTANVNDDAAVEGATSNAKGGVIYSSVFYDPTIPVKDQNGNYSDSDDLLLPNPVTVYEGIRNEIQTNRTFGTFGLNYQIIDGLTTNLNLGTDRQTVRRDTYNSKITYMGKAVNGAAYINTLIRSNVLAEYTLSYTRKINENHHISAVAGVTYQKFVSMGEVSSVSDFPTDILSTNNLSFGNPNQASVGSFKNENSLLSYLGRVNYNIMEKYLITGTFRADGSSRFGKNNKFGYFPSFAFAWKVHEEDFIPALFNELKLRTSWGLTGNQEIPDYCSLATFTSSGTAVFNSAQATATSPSRLANPDLKWESTEQYNIGIDFGILKGRISGSIDYFIKNTRDMLIDMPQPLSSGYNTKLTNIGKMRNNGVEIVINSRNIVGNHFRWNTNLNFSALKNEVLDIGGLDRIITGWVPEASDDGTIIKPGLPLNSYYGFKVTGIFQTDEQVAASVQTKSKPGYPIFQNTVNDKEINNDDRVVLGNPFPDFIFGINNTFTYKNWNLMVNFTGQYGNELLNATTIGFMYPANFRRNRSSMQVNDRWTPENPGAKWPSGTLPTSYGGGRINSLAVENASYIKLQAIQLGYNIPVNGVKFIESARVNLTIENVFLWTNYSGINPDANLYGRSNAQIDFMSYPLARTWMLGVNLSF